MHTRSLVALTVMTSVVAPSYVRADDPTALADSLFEEGRRLAFDEGKWVEACPKFEESHRLRPGGGVVLNLALCYRNVGRVASAHARYKEGLALAIRDKNEPRIKLATDALTELEPQLPHIAVTVRPDADVPGLTIQLDALTIAKAARATPLAVDPGDHVVVVTAPNKVERRLTVRVAIGESRTVDITPLADVPSPPTKTLVVEDPDAGRRTVGIVLAGVGVVGLGVGTYFGLRALDARSESRARGCTVGACDREGSDLTRDAVTYGNISTVAFGVGVASVAVGSYLFFTSRGKTTAVVALDATRLSVGLTMRF